MADRPRRDLLRSHDAREVAPSCRDAIAGPEPIACEIRASAPSDREYATTDGEGSLSLPEVPLPTVPLFDDGEVTVIRSRRRESGLRDSQLKSLDGARAPSTRAVNGVERVVGV
jgi:hypothetical protein